MANEILAKIRLLDYAIFKFTFDNSTEPPKDSSGVEFGMDFDIKISAENELIHRIDLKIGLNNSDSAYEQAGFRLAIELTGLFELDQGLAKEEADRLLALNGLSMLFSTARGVIAQLTSQAPIGKVVLPSINIAEYLRLKAEEEESKKEGTKKRRKKAGTKS